LRLKDTLSNGKRNKFNHKEHKDRKETEKWWRGGRSINAPTNIPSIFGPVYVFYVIFVVKTQFSLFLSASFAAERHFVEWGKEI
jgi:hypothetical protein